MYRARARHRGLCRSQAHARARRTDSSSMLSTVTAGVLEDDPNCLAFTSRDRKRRVLQTHNPCPCGAKRVSKIAHKRALELPLGVSDAVDLLNKCAKSAPQPRG